MTTLKLGYWSPTPVRFRKLGDALLAASLLIATYAQGQDNGTLALIAMWIGVIGKVITNLFTEETLPPMPE